MTTTTSLRARKQAVSSRNEARIKELKRGKDETAKDGKEARSKAVLAALFLLVCLVGGIREYQKQETNVVIHHHDDNNNNNNMDIPDGFESLLSPLEDASLEEHEDGTVHHLIFSTDCSPYQHWQSYLVYYTAMKVKQPGHVTRIASGCGKEEAKAMKEWFAQHVQGMSRRFHLHLTPHFSGVKDEKGETVGDYKFFNKPFGLKHWLEHGQQQRQDDDIVILIDPDMALLRPIVGNFDNNNNKDDTVISPKRRDHLLGLRVDTGLPFAQTYGLGAQWERFDLDAIAGADSPTKLVTKEEGALYFPAGPPYLATVQDMYEIALKWTDFVPRVHAQYPHLLAEMYAYCIASAHLGLRHQLIDSLMVSNTQVSGEGWSLIDIIPPNETCEYAQNLHNNAHNHHQYPVPSVVHLCQRYSVGQDWFFGKRKVPDDMYECATPLFEEPPPDLALLYDYRQPPNAKEKTMLKPKIVNRETFMVCFLTRLINEAATYHKTQSCPADTANLNKSIKFADLFHRRQQTKS